MYSIDEYKCHLCGIVSNILPPPLQGSESYRLAHEKNTKATITASY